MKIRTLAALACLIAVTVGCYPKGSASVPDVKELFDSNRDAYVAVLNAALAAPTPRNTDTNTIYRRNSAVFETVVPLPPFLGVSLPPTNSVSRPVTIDIFAYGMAVSGRTVGLAYFEHEIPDPDALGSSVQILQSCDALDTQDQDNTIYYDWVYCELDSGWYAFRHSF
tara:strand:- start:35 stop:538 length:504 start_codon:yes stop_codon:yes gene_type:complete